MNKLILIVVVIFSLAIAATYYPWQQTEQDESITDNDPTTERNDFLKLPEDDARQTIKYPVTEAPGLVSDTNSGTAQTSESEQSSVAVPTVSDPFVMQAAEPLPQLDESDDDISAAINQLTDVTELFSFKSFIRHFVVTIDNMTNQKIPQRYVFNQRVPDKFAVIKQDEDNAILDSKNFKRYVNFVNLAERINTRKLVAHYVRFYPLFQEAYEELGYPDRYFNDRFIQVMDHLLAAPEIKGPIKLIRPKVFYQFANPELEALSAGQKILVRIGVENAQRVKSKLKELRGILTTLPPR
ncbi:MAG: DUF3014 domain-containing protein [Gammaproteobacteria bacterium]|nr:DUF3014 domain-containing protein [Gammaproteobacteria bacterium]